MFSLGAASSMAPPLTASFSATTYPEIPPSMATMEVSIVDSTGSIVGAAGSSVSPTIRGQSTFNFDSYCFLLEHSEDGVRLLFDAGARVDWWNLTAGNVESIQDDIPGFAVEKSINQVLQEGGVDDKSVSAVIWSHAHFDHTGDLSLFPPSTDLVVGSGFKEEYMPGFPTDPDAVLLDSDFAGRTVEEVDFNHDNLAIGGFRAVDYFGDGALYLLDTPGHAPAHLSALVRTTPNTFIFLGGDICDVPQVLRPAADNPLPREFNLELPPLCSSPHSKGLTQKRADERTRPISQVSDSEISFYEDPPTSQQSVDTLQRFDADPNILVAFAHDRSLRPILRFFPDGNINDWKAQGWKRAAMWEFLRDLPSEGKAPRDQMIVDGLYRNGTKLRSVEDVLENLDPDQIGRC